MAALDFDKNPNTESSVSTGDITWKLSKNAGDGTPIWYATTDATQIIHVGVSAPPSPRLGQMWWCSATADEGGGRLYVYFDDVWVDASLPGGGGASGDFLSKTEDDTAAGKITLTADAAFKTDLIFSTTQWYNWQSSQHWKPQVLQINLELWQVN